MEDKKITDKIYKLSEAIERIINIQPEKAKIIKCWKSIILYIDGDYKRFYYVKENESTLFAALSYYNKEKAHSILADCFFLSLDMQVDSKLMTVEDFEMKDKILDALAEYRIYRDFEPLKILLEENPEIFVSNEMVRSTVIDNLGSTPKTKTPVRIAKERDTHYILLKAGELKAKYDLQLFTNNKIEKADSIAKRIVLDSIKNNDLQEFFWGLETLESKIKKVKSILEKQRFKPGYLESFYRGKLKVIYRNNPQAFTL
ncbi:MAG: hypothetical protein AB7E04_12515 [Desulfobacteraceae bacterium]